MRCGLAGVMAALALNLWPGAGLAQAPPPMELPMPTAETTFATSPPTPQLPGELFMPMGPNCGLGGPRILGYGYDPTRGILTFTVHDDPAPLIWEGYTGPGRPPEWFALCWGRLCRLCGR